MEKSRSKTCCVLSDGARDTFRIKSVQHSEIPPQCQFEGKDNFKDLYEYNGKQFCILHYPIEAESDSERKRKIEIEKEKVFYQLLEDGVLDFSCVDLEGVKIKNLSEPSKEIVFTAAKFWSLNIENVDIHRLLINGTEFRGVTKILNCKVNILQLLNSVVYEEIHFDTLCADNFIIQNSHIKSSQKGIRTGGISSNAFILKKAKVDQFVFNRGVCELELRFNESKFGRISFHDVRFFQPPSFAVMDLSKTELYLPEIKDFDGLKKIEKQFCKYKYFFCYLRKYKERNNTNIKFITYLKQFLKNVRNDKKEYNCTMDDYYKKFRNIYNICRDKKMYYEQGIYYTLMQRSLEKTVRLKKSHKFSSRCYDVFSGYGQSIGKPLFFLVLLFFMFCMIFYTLGDCGLKDSFILSLSNTFNLLKTFGTKVIPGNGLIFIISIIETIFSLSLILLLVLALRWNFRKS